MTNTITGTIKEIFKTIQVSENFKKREFVITDNTNTKYPQYVSFQLTQDKCAILDGFKIGDTVTVNYNLRGRAWTSTQGEIKYFNTLEAWKITGSIQTKSDQEVEFTDLHF